MNKMLLFCSVLMMGCAQPNNGLNGLPGPAGPAATLPMVDDVSVVISEANALRSAQGSESYVPGLGCNLYTVPTSATQIIGATLTSVGGFSYNGVFDVPNESVTAGLSLLPEALQKVYQTWIVVKCTGVMVNTDDAWHEFDITSDDGSNLYVDGLLINNDGLHGVQTKSNVKFLNRGVHSFEVDYLQGAGNQALIVNKDGALLNSNVLYH